MLTLGHLVVGVYLYGEIPLGIDNLGEQGQLVVVSLGDGLTEERDGLTGDDLVELAPFPGAIVHDGFRTGNGRDGPVLCTPDKGLPVLFEKKGICHDDKLTADFADYTDYSIIALRSPLPLRNKPHGIPLPS